ncbi:hypothetical protein DAEQUDRAFT_720836 [Daedalea quercina L-15889]|uniref:PLP-dependent transferase n=1 Tax=Daedalea quercina L-15889 TaxID=1314783 RepID=A0A165TUZ8_9APHY|nr:hypothetical protein DAEQUDRAFT_720836 [Daedalea quercina L-15889]
MDVAQLETELLSLVQAGHAIYAVVAIMGTTEHGAVDPLDKVLSLRHKLQDEHGISFLVHCDAAWGGYFASLLHPAPPEYKGGRDLDDGGVYVPHQALSRYTETQLRSMRYADSITVDPHKSGYIPYPAGGLCYKDERLKYLITWTGPYIDGGASDVESMGVYGLEGSKPGAAPVAAYISNEVIGLHRGGYGGLLGEAMFTSVKMYAHWATMTLESDTLIVTPFNMLPAEREGRPVEEVEAQRAFIRRNIVDRPNRELVRDPEAMDLVRKMGSDLSINAFACNFRMSRGGPPNRDVAEASYLNRRIIERLSVSRVDDEACKKSVLLMGSQLDQERYGSCLAGFKQRLGLNPEDPAPLAGLCNVSMTPFPTAGNFVRELADSFRKVAEEEVQNCWKRVHVVPAIHSFIMQGTEDLFLAYLPMFNWGSYRQQLIVSAKLPADVMEAYVRARRERPAAVFSLHTSSKELLSNILQRRSCLVDVHEGLPMLHGIADASNTLYRTQVELMDIIILKHVELHPNPLHSGYPHVMIFFLYGTPKEQHIDHMLLTKDNVQLSSSCVQLDFGPSTERILSEIGSKSALMLVFDDLREHEMQPFGGRHKPDFFAPNRTFRVTLRMDPCLEYGPAALNMRLHESEIGEPVAQGTITLGESVYVDYVHLNRDTVPQLCITPMEQLTRDQLLLSVTNDYQRIVDDLVRIVSHESAGVAPDIEEHILARAALPSKYSLGKASDSQETGTAPSKVHVSRFTIPHPSDAYSRQMTVRNGWKDMFDARVADCRAGN